MIADTRLVAVHRGMFLVRLGIYVHTFGGSLTKLYVVLKCFTSVDSVSYLRTTQLLLLLVIERYFYLFLDNIWFHLNKILLLSLMT